MRFWPGRLLHARNSFASTLILLDEVVAKAQVQPFDDAIASPQDESGW
jgi:hypothetical protein